MTDAVIDITAEEIRLPERVREALASGRRVCISRYGRPAAYLLGGDQYALVAPLLDLIDQGVHVSHELLMSSDDIALARDLAEDRETTPAEQAVIDELLAERGG
jgi:PHD/YefM family antitoxin component YafN of YafNO toxin-antitoxin module